MLGVSCQGSSTNSSLPHVLRSSVSCQPRRTDGRVTRVRWWMVVGTMSGMYRGFGSLKRPSGDDPFALEIDLESATVARGHLSLTCGTISNLHIPQRVASTRMEVRLRQSGAVVKLCAKPSPTQMKTKHSRNSSHAKISSNGGQNFGAFDPAHRDSGRGQSTMRCRMVPVGTLSHLARKRGGTHAKTAHLRLPVWSSR